jgi:hypothetical protein
MTQWQKPAREPPKTKAQLRETEAVRNTAQPESDSANPVMPRAGHIAFILPNFARGRPHPGMIGMYEFLGGGRWEDHSVRGSAFFRLG